MYGEEILKEYTLTFGVTGVTIDKENVKLTLGENGEIIYKSNIGICNRCGGKK